MCLLPKDAAKFVASHATHVKIHREGVEKLGDVLVDEINSGRLSCAQFTQAGFHPTADKPWAIDWLFVVDTLNFCFWHNENEAGWTVEGQSGYFALCAAINRAQKDKVDILNPKFYSIITEEQLRKILKGDTSVECPLISERVKCLHEVGNVLLEKFDGSFHTVLKLANHSALELLKLITDNFSCFRDEAVYKNQKICIYKRAQILVADIWSCFSNKGVGYFKDIGEISAFADYRIPQTLLWYGVITYDDELLEKLNKNIVIANGDKEEVEIRACSLHAVELLNEYATKKLGNNKINSVLIDQFLWDFRRKHAKEVLAKGLPFHKTSSIYY